MPTKVCPVAFACSSKCIRMNFPTLWRYTRQATPVAQLARMCSLSDTCHTPMLMSSRTCLKERTNRSENMAVSISRFRKPKPKYMVLLAISPQSSTRMSSIALTQASIPLVCRVGSHFTSRSGRQWLSERARLSKSKSGVTTPIRRFGTNGPWLWKKVELQGPESFKRRLSITQMAVATLLDSERAIWVRIGY